ncbi:MAG: DUF72 domain-containing protein [Burkholderiales bacterium]
MQRSRTSPRGDIRIGISGWRYEPWRGTFYPAGLAQARELEYASRQLRTIEINGSFYSLQSPACYRRWYQDTPEDFVFSVKGGRFITHMKQLVDVGTALGNFFASGVAELREKLGPFLWQLPPRMVFDAEKIERFLALLPRDTDAASALARRHDGKLKVRARIAFGPARRLRHAMEVRHPSFVVPEFVALLRKYGVAFVIADTAGKWPEYEDVTADFVYMRLHGAVTLYQSRYTEEELDRFAARIERWSRGREPADAHRMTGRHAPAARRRDVFCYFDNTDKIEAPANAQRLADLVGAGVAGSHSVARRRAA